MINASLQERLFLAPFKEDLVYPFLKKPSIGPTCLHNFSPVSHLTFLRKVVEKLVVLQLQRILDEMYYLDPFQLHFKMGHGTEMALVMLTAELWQKWDGNSASLLSLTS